MMLFEKNEIYYSLKSFSTYYGYVSNACYFRVLKRNENSVVIESLETFETNRYEIQYDEEYDCEYVIINMEDIDYCTFKMVLCANNIK